MYKTPKTILGFEQQQQQQQQQQEVLFCQ